MKDEKTDMTEIRCDTRSTIKDLQDRDILLKACEVYIREYEAYMADDSQLYPDQLLEVAGPIIYAAVEQARK